MLQTFGKSVLFMSRPSFFYFQFRKCFKCIRPNFDPRAIILKISFPTREFLPEVPDIPLLLIKHI
jgi:hypothetical protein